MKSCSGVEGKSNMRTKQRNFGRLAYTISRRTKRRMGNLCVGIKEKRVGLSGLGQAADIKGCGDWGGRYDYVTSAQELERAGASLWLQSRFGRRSRRALSNCILRQ